MIVDLLWAAADIARVSVTRPVAFRDLLIAREELRSAPSWTAIFVKGFALVAAEVPELRRVYIRRPWPYLYEYAESTVCIAHERWIMGDLGLLPLRFHKPDAVPKVGTRESAIIFRIVKIWRSRVCQGDHS